MTAAIGTISEGTLRPRDLIPRLEAALRIYHPAAYTQLMLLPFPRVPGDAQFSDSDDYWYSQAASDYVDELIEALNECADPGVYFGAHPGDGADLGFWCEEES